MSEAEGTATVLTEASDTATNSMPPLTIHVSRRGELGQKELRFTVEDFSVVDKMYVLSGSGDVFVTFEHWQLITEPLAERIANAIAEAIADALDFAPGHVTVTISDNLLM